MESVFYSLLHLIISQLCFFVSFFFSLFPLRFACLGDEQHAFLLLLLVFCLRRSCEIALFFPTGCISVQCRIFINHVHFLFVFLLFILWFQVVGPPGTGKTDVAVQIISNLYHNFPEQRTLIVTHSNQVRYFMYEIFLQLK